ncbi:carboxypeptidase-like regulatory domain-containing protein [Flavobacterium jejuense]|uniref:Carboxypeptidase-like regulatory domain-containing protein n=1 Tax=Flavobacterium jejuense TaxID=1544455 RepID=A0ABX0IPH3_9FLAO|nr:carboxypeptidase-like regulatory domain-containing protein [Flavobacterium jejuense]NHN25598.1 carboxypeptidase-like regulatory domain-containing protein [Flavobacterium jejuense]
MKYILIFLLLTKFSLSAQVKGIVRDSLTGQPIPFVNIWVENEETGTTSDFDGSFSINVKGTNKKLVFSALGFLKKSVKVVNAKEVYLKASVIELNEVVLLNKKDTKEIEIGKTPNTILQTFDNGPKIEAKYFPYKDFYKKIKFIKKVSIHTDSKIEKATIKIHFYSVNEDGSPGKELLNKDFLVSINKGILKNKFDISDYNLVIPTNGIFVAYEKLMIESNKLERQIIDPYTKREKTQKTYYPLVLYNYVERDFLYSFFGGKWNKKTNEKDPLDKLTIFEPAINLILTN